MTNKEAINFMGQIRATRLSTNLWLESTREPFYEAFDLAISALQSQDSTSSLVSKNVIKNQMIKYGFTAPDMTVTEFVEDCLPSAHLDVPDNNVGDTISRQALCEYALNQKDKSITPNDIMRFPSAQPEQRWIPCSERLPEEETDVLICNINGDIALSSGSYSTEVKDYFIWYTSGWRFGKVIAWMPLPEPWKEESDG